MKGTKGLAATTALIMILFSPAAHAIGKKTVLLDELYEQAGLYRQLNWVKASMTLGYADYDLPNDVLDAFNQVIKVRYSADYFKLSMMSTLDQALTVDELLRLIEWYESPLGQKIIKLEAIANNPMNAPRIQTYIEERLSKQLPRSSRSDLIEALMVALDVVEHGTELAATTSVGVQRLLQEIMPMLRGQAEAPQVLKAREKPGIRREMAQRMKGILFYTYRTLSDQEISRYLDFARSPAMQNFQRGQVYAVAQML